MAWEIMINLAGLVLLGVALLGFALRLRFPWFLVEIVGMFLLGMGLPWTLVLFLALMGVVPAVFIDPLVIWPRTANLPANLKGKKGIRLSVVMNGLLLLSLVSGRVTHWVINVSPLAGRFWPQAW